MKKLLLVLYLVSSLASTAPSVGEAASSSRPNTRVSASHGPSEDEISWWIVESIVQYILEKLGIEVEEP